jgi:pyruvate/2-oxoglutarate dehydrogenase complex dihydrolipoamide dehydrogenase (E3) component
MSRDAIEERLSPVRPLDAHNRRLVENVRPPAWVNPEPAGRYNMVVLGAGTAGLVTAAGAAGLGAKVALVERALLGGDCLNVGCVPSKALIRCARASADARSAGQYGVRVGGDVRADFGAVMERMRRLRADISPNDSAERFRGLGVDVFIGQARFAGRDTVQVGDKTLRFAKACIATGDHALVPPVPGLEEAGYLTNETLFSLTELPRRFAVVGAGPIGCEIAQAFARFGAGVHLIEMAEQILIREDRDAAELVEKALRADGVEILLGATLTRVRKDRDGKTLFLQSAGRERELEVDEVLIGVGRSPNLDGLDLEAAAVAYDGKNGVEVDEHLRTTNPRIYAAGDVCLPYKFTHLADATARLVIRNALFFGRSKWTSLTIPWCTYTDPEVAHVGLSEHEAKERGIAVRTFAQALGKVDRAVLDGEAAGFVKVHVREGSDRIAGATIVARHAGEMLPELTLGINAGIGLGKIAETIHTYPTQAEAIKKVADAYNRTRLTPFVKSLFERLMAWSR